jgi:hypothetical protein
MRRGGGNPPLTERTYRGDLLSSQLNKLVSVPSGIDYAYRGRAGAGYRWSCSTISAATSTAGIPRRSMPWPRTAA